MKKILLNTLLIITCASVYAQVNIDKAIQLTGSDSDAKISGIKEVTGSQDATSVESLQKGILIYSDAGGSGDAITLSLSPPIGAYATGMIVNFKASAPNTGAVTIDVNGLGPVYIKKSVISDLGSGDLSTGQMVSVIYDGTNFQMISSSGGASANCAVPSQPGSISGPPAVEPYTQNAVYTVASYSGVFAYDWTVPAGATIVSGQGYNTITVNFGNTSGNISVTGNNHCGASSASSFSVSVNQPKVIFVTSSTYSSNESPTQRDGECQFEANINNLSGTFKAWVSNGATNNISPTSGYIYKRVDGALIAYDWADLVDGSIASPINISANNFTFNDSIYTGLSASGIVSANTCSDWTSTSNSVQGTFGISFATDGNWSNAGNKPCATPAIPTFLGWVGDPGYFPALTICQNCYGGTYLNGTQFGNFSNVPYTVGCGIIPTWNSVTCARCNKDVVSQTYFRHYCVEQ